MTAPGPARVGLIVPSSNTALEPALIEMGLPTDEVVFHMSRARVTSVSLQRESLEQFETGPMCQAASLLADARPDVLVWAGTAGLWRGLRSDRALCDAITQLTSVPAVTTGLALVEACRWLGARRVALVTPYLVDVVDRIVKTFANEGVTVSAERHLRTERQPRLRPRPPRRGAGPGSRLRVRRHRRRGHRLHQHERGKDRHGARTPHRSHRPRQHRRIRLVRPEGGWGGRPRTASIPGPWETGTGTSSDGGSMKFVTFATAALEERVGAVLDDVVLDLLGASGGNPVFGSMVALAASGPEGRAAAAALCADAGTGTADGPFHHRAGELRLLAPVPRPVKNVYCVGLNYRSHVEQNAAALGEPVVIPEVPLFFSKPVTAVIGQGAPVRHDSRLTHKLDYEVELAVVIGKKGTWIDPERAYDHVFGFTIVNDISARDLQWRTSQFLYGKGLDSYCPMGPTIVTVDEMPSLDQVLLELRVNGEVRQSETAGNMLFPPQAAIAELSRGITLKLGDVISLGTPGGCGYQSTPPSFLQPGDIVECRATVIGSLINTVVGVTGDSPAHMANDSREPAGRCRDQEEGTYS